MAEPVSAQHPKAPTIYDVARAAGVSHQTVSRLLKGEDALRPATRQRVEKALVALDYRPNEAARVLATNRSHRIGAFVSHLTEWAPQHIVDGAAAAAREAGYLLDIATVGPHDAASVAQAVRLMSRTRLAGAIVVTPSDLVLEAVERARLPLPLVVESETDTTHDAAAAAGHPFGQLVEHLAALGHRRFFHIAGPGSWLAARVRTASYHAKLASLGLTSAGEADGDWSAASGHRAMADFPADAGITAVVAANDQMALGAMHWLFAAGCDVPGDVSVVGYDGLVEGAFFRPPLTTVEVDYTAVGRRTMAQLLGAMGLDTVPDAPSPRHQLVVRASTAAPGSRP